jgi:hypothetical protein
MISFDGVILMISRTSINFDIVPCVLILIVVFSMSYLTKHAWLSKEYGSTTRGKPHIEEMRDLAVSLAPFDEFGRIFLEAVGELT